MYAQSHTCTHTSTSLGIKMIPHACMMKPLFKSLLQTSMGLSRSSHYLYTSECWESGKSQLHRDGAHLCTIIWLFSVAFVN